MHSSFTRALVVSELRELCEGCKFEHINCRVDQLHCRGSAPQIIADLGLLCGVVQGLKEIRSACSRALISTLAFGTISDLDATSAIFG